MRIVDNEDNTEIFGDIDIGENFKCNGCYYMKIAEVRNPIEQQCVYNAVGLNTGCLVFFDMEIIVESVELEAKVVG